MNVPANKQKKKLRPVVIVGLIVLAVAYHFSRPTLERWFNTSLPSLTQTDNQTASSGSSGNSSDYSVSLPDSGKKQSGDVDSDRNRSQDLARSREESQAKDKTPPRNNLSPGEAARDWLTDIGRGRYQSPAGLVYTGGREHRIDHVLRHCEDDPSKPTHGVFVGDAVEVMKLVDEAYELAKSGKAKPQQSDGKTTYTVSMGRVVGHTGGRKAKRNGKRKLRSVKLVLAENRVITAFPTN